jgi:hypothetical protein
VPGGGGGGGRAVKIGYVSPQAGPLAGFGEADDYILGGVREILKDGLKVGSQTHPVEIRVKDSQSDPTGPRPWPGTLINGDQVDLQPDAAFSVNWTAFMIFIVIIGGVGSIAGLIRGTIVFFALQHMLAPTGPGT